MKWLRFLQSRPVCPKITLNVALPTTWHLWQPAPGWGDITDIERECAAEAGVKIGGFDFLPEYETADDAKSVAVAMMIKRTDIVVGIACSDDNPRRMIPLTNEALNVRLQWVK